MSLNPPARCLIRASKSAANKPRCPSQAAPVRTFHQSSSHNVRKRRLPYANLKTEELAEIDEGAKHIRGYTKEEWKAMKRHYTPAQIESIQQGEKAVDPRDLVTQGGLRSDPWRMKYVEDFRVIDPLVDNQPTIWPTQAPKYFVTEAQDQEFSDRAVEMMTGGMDARSIEQMIEAVQKSPVATQKAKDFAERFRPMSMTDHEATGKRVLRKLLYRLEKGASLLEGRVDPLGTQTSVASAGSSAEEVNSFFDATGLQPDDELSLLQTGDKEAFRSQLNDPRFSSLAPKIPRFNDPRVRFEDAGDEASAADTGLARLSLMTGQPIDVLKRINTKELVYRRVVNQTRMGKIASSSILCIAGNGNGLIGIGEGKSTEASDARIQAQMGAIRNMKPILRYEDRTIFGEVEAKVGATEVELSSRPPGFGVRCQHLIFEVCKLAGIHDLSARVVRSRNPMNTVKATFEALTKQRLPEDIARARGKKLVDVRKVYYAGAV